MFKFVCVVLFCLFAENNRMACHTGAVSPYFPFRIWLSLEFLSLSPIQLHQLLLKHISKYLPHINQPMVLHAAQDLSSTDTDTEPGEQAIRLFSAAIVWNPQSRLVGGKKSSRPHLMFF